MQLDAVLLSSQHYKVRIKGKVEQPWEWSSAFCRNFIEKVAFGSASTNFANFTLLLEL